MNYVNSSVMNDNCNQQTLKRKVHFSGVGVHNGRAVSMVIEPAQIDTGIVFQRIDLNENNTIKAIINNVVDSSLCTKIKNNNGVYVSTIEHLMAAFSALNIDNALVKINSSELPCIRW